MRARDHVRRSPTIFVADRLTPRLGMARALAELARDLSPRTPVMLVTLSGAADLDQASEFRSLQCPPGLRGRLSALRRLRSLAKEFPASVFVGVGIWACVTTAVATIGCPIRIVLWEHTVLPWRLRHEPKVATAALLMRCVSWRVTRIIAVSQATGQTARLLYWPRRGLSVIPNIVTQTVAQTSTTGSTSHREAGTALFGAGSLTHTKNWSLAITAMVHLPDEYNLSIAGEGPERSRLETLIRNLRLESRVTLLGYRSDITGLISAADVIVHPSLAETFGYSLMEAAEQSRPVVALAMPVMDELVPELVCGVRCLHPKPDEFASAVLKANSYQFDFDVTFERRKSFASHRVVRQWLDVLAAAQD